jgi:hypothetical protein
MTTEAFPDTDDSRAELAIPDDADTGTLEVFPPARSPMAEARAMLADHRAMLEDAHYTANVVCQTPMAPQRYRGKPKEATVAIMYGAELGLPPLASMQKVINIHGSPSVEARTMKGLLKAKGFQFRTIVKAEDEFVIHAWEPTSDKRTDPPDEVAHWTMARAIKARYVPVPSSEDSLCRPDVDDDWVTVTKTWEGKTKKSVLGNMKYITDPIGMLEAKGTADVCRAIAPEILMGLPYAAEERDDFTPDEPDPEPVKSAPARARGVAKLRDRAKAAQAAPDSGEEPVDADVVDDEPAGAGAAQTPPPAPAPDIAPAPPEAEPEPEKVTPPPPAATPPAAEPELPTDGDIELSPADRRKGLDMMAGLFISGGAADVVERAEVMSEIVAKMPGATYRAIKNGDQLSNAELKWVVDTLRSAKQADKLQDYVGEAANMAALRAAGVES